MSAAVGTSAPAETSGRGSALRVLLWSPLGAGEDYHGPGSFAYRLYSGAPPGRFVLTLAHGADRQRPYPLFERVFHLGAIGGSPVSHLLFQRRGRQFLRAHWRDFDVFHGLSAFHNTVSPAFLAERLGLPAVVFLTNHRLELTDKGGLKALLGLPRRRRKMARELSALVAMSRAIYDELLEHGIEPRRIARIPMGVDTGQFRPASLGERAGLRSVLGWRALPTVLFVGAVTRRKRPHLLVEALGSLRGRGGECQLVIAGPEHDAGYAAAMRARALELGIEHLIVWHGFTPEIAPLYRAADFFALPSEREGMPAALVEAMASGLPAIVTAVSGAVDLVDDGVHGQIVPPEAGAIADALRTYLADPGTADSHGAAGRRRVEQQYSATAVREAYERLFRRVMAGGDAAE